jgi:hypothetical protein
MICKIWGFHGGDYEEFRLLVWHKIPEDDVLHKMFSNTLGWRLLVSTIEELQKRVQGSPQSVVATYNY